MQALKVLVTILTILIIIAVTVIAYGMYRKSADPDFKFFKLGDNYSSQGEIQLPASPNNAGAIKNGVYTPSAFGEVILPLPKGCNISTVNGNGYRLFLKVGPTGTTCERVIVIDPANGALLGTIKVSP